MQKKKNFIYWMLAGFILSSLILPEAFLNKMFFLVIIGGNFVKKRTVTLSIKVPVIILSIFSLGFLHGQINGGETSLAIQFLFSIAMMFLIYPIIDNQINVSELIKRITPFYEIVSLLFIIYGINQLPFLLPEVVIRMANALNVSLINAIGNVLRDYGATAIGYRSFFGGDGVMIHLGSVPFLIVPIGLFSKELFTKGSTKKCKKIIVIAIALLISVISTSRALVLSELLIIGLAYIKTRKMSGKLISTIVAVVVVIVVADYLINNSTVFSATEIGNNIKLGHIKGFFSNLNIKNMLIGDGLASFYYSPVYGGYLAHTEITLLDYMRYFGVFFGIYVYILLVFPFNRINVRFVKESFDIFVFGMYLLVSLTNPVLFNSIGMIVILYYWNECYLFDKRIRDTRMKVEYE